MAYAAVISLKHTIERLSNAIDPQIARSAYEELEFLKETLTRLDGSTNSSCNRTAINSLDDKIREAASELEDVLESYVKLVELQLSKETLIRLDEINCNWSMINSEDAQIREAVSKLRDALESYEFLSYPPPSHRDRFVKKEIGCFVKTAKKLKEDYKNELEKRLPKEQDAADSRVDHFGGKTSTKTVGLKDQFEEIMNELMDFQSKLKIISLYGMAGIGKTHLVREVYQLSTIIQEFDLRILVRIGPKFHLQNILADVAAQIDQKPLTAYIHENTKTLADRIYKSLFGQRFLVVLDDMWSTAAWDALKRCFPVEENGSRILLTTRLEEAATYSSTSNNAHQIRFLNKEESWELLWRNVFAPLEEFPFKLEKAGRKIAENCEGLPLLILTVAEILRGLKQTEEFWMEVAKMKYVFPEAYEKISEVLLLSYEYLPQYLKACFLYMGVFPKNSEISISKLVDLWTIEDFLEPNQPHTLDVFAMNCLNKLVSQSLAIVCKQSSNFGIKSSKLHSAYWHLCVKEGRKNKFLYVLNSINDVLEGCIDDHRRLCVQNNILLGIEEVFSSLAKNLMTRSLLCTGKDHQYPVPLCFNLLLLQVLDALAIRFYEFPEEVVKLLQLRYLALTSNGKLPRFISILKKLQCLILRYHHNIKFVRDLNSDSDSDSTCLPKEIWDMQELRHLRIMGNNLPYPSYDAELPNLLTLHVNSRSCTEEVFRSMPKLKKLGVRIELHPDADETLSCFEHVSVLYELEALKCAVLNPHLRAGVVAPPHHLSNLPGGLKKLSLSGLGYPLEYMSVIGSLPNLRVLKLQCCAFRGPKWETKVEEFPKLEFLLLEDIIDLVQWTADHEECLPCLRRLIIRNCYKLKAIPSEIGAIPALKTIEIVDCSPSVVASALKIKDAEEEYGNFYLQVLVISSWKFK